MAGTQAERDGILKWGGKMFKAQRRARVPKLHVTLRKSFGFGSTTMGQNPFDHQTLQLRVPGRHDGRDARRRGGRSAKLDDATQAQVEARQRSGPWGMAAGMTYDDVIDPRELRNALLSGLALARDRIRGAVG